MSHRIILNETSHFGPGSRSVLPDEIKRRGFKKALFVTDKELIKFGVAAKVFTVLDAAGVPYVVFDDIKQNPTVANVTNGLAAFKASGADFIVAVGGGSSIDTAKAVGIPSSPTSSRSKASRRPKIAACRSSRCPPRPAPPPR